MKTFLTLIALLSLMPAKACVIFYTAPGRTTPNLSTTWDDVSFRAEDTAPGTCRYATLLYSTVADSPFQDGIHAGSIHFEDFEDGQLNAPNILGTAGTVFPGLSLERPPGTGNGLGGFTWRAGDVPIVEDDITEWNVEQSIQFAFTPDAEGHLPRYFGFGVTEGQTQGGARLYDPDGNLAAEIWFPGRAGIQSPAPAYWYGFSVPGGISRIQIRGVDRLDHLQYGFTIPEPATAALAASGLLLLARRRR